MLFGLSECNRVKQFKGKSNFFDITHTIVISSSFFGGRGYVCKILIKTRDWHKCHFLTLLHSARPKLHIMLAFLIKRIYRLYSLSF